MKVADFPVVHFYGSDTGSIFSLDLAGQGGPIKALARYFDRHFPDTKRVGLIFRNTPDLLLSWLALLAAGREPLILQYPTSKQVFTHWERSIANSIAIADLEALVIDPNVDTSSFSIPSATMSRDIMASLPREAEGIAEIASGAMLQLSSGTTGSRKPVRFTLEQVRAHIEDYADGFIRPGDCIVSWLPLYHDMGFVACWLMSLMTGTRLVLMDPIDWTGNPAILFEAVRRYEGSLCYLPNFAFEVMSRVTGHGPFPSMRAWISCSEPVYEASVRRFMAAAQVPEAAISACYAMAENVFAVTQSRGLVLAEVDGVTRVSCGTPIRNCALQIRDGQIWVRSRSSITAYVGSEPIIDGDGYYPTGDLGAETPNGLVITGRVNDLINVAGRKSLLNDLDRALQSAVPEARGRIVTCVHRSEDFGTEQPVFFAEDEFFYRRKDAARIREELISLTGVTNLVFHFVPQGFIIKTSSGKANRAATLQRWVDLKEDMAASGKSFLDEVGDAFGPLPKDRPIKDLLDSLGQVYLRLLARVHGVALTSGSTLDDLIAQGRDAGLDGRRPHVSIIALCDRHVVAKVQAETLDRFSEIAGCPVTFEHINAPPSEILLNDIIFMDYFREKTKSQDYDAISDVINKIKNASLLIIDDVSEVAFPFEQVYPRLDHQHNRSSEADLLGYRWQQYTLRHHRLPIQAVWGVDLNTDRNESIERLSNYLDVPILRVATLPMFLDKTESWDLVERVNWRHDGALYQPPGLEPKIAEWLAQGRLRRIAGDIEVEPQPRDLPHFCGWAFDQPQLEEILQRHERFCILGTRSSLPWIPQRLDQLSKTYFFNNSVDLSHIDKDSFDCILMTGAWGQIVNGECVYQPVYQLLWAGFFTTKIDYIGDRLRNLRLELENNYASLTRGDGPTL